VYPPQAEQSYTLQMLVCIELAGIDEDDLRAIVNDRQWSVLANIRHRGEMMRPHFVKQGWYEP
jgi:hypothetical protein